MKHSLAALTLLAVLGGSNASAGSDVEVGALTCKLADASNYVVYTDEKFDCTFDPTEGDNETYTGQISNIGVDLQVKKDMTLVWGVLAPTKTSYKPGALKGTYVGGSAEVSLGGGVGAKVLVGGGEESFTLQPISVSGIVGGGAAVGIQSFELK